MHLLFSPFCPKYLAQSLDGISGEAVCASEQKYGYARHFGGVLSRQVRKDLVWKEGRLLMLDLKNVQLIFSEFQLESIYLLCIDSRQSRLNDFIVLDDWSDVPCRNSLRHHFFWGTFYSSLNQEPGKL